MSVNYKEEFCSIANTYIKRAGIEDLLNWLANETDFFTAPASARFHLAIEHGLVIHSTNVYKRLVKLLVCEYGEKWETVLGITHETVAIIALFHDVSKIFNYIPDTKNVKVGNDWVKEQFYRYNDKPAEQYLYGSHAENSVYFINNFMLTSHLENVCIRHHMGGKDYGSGMSDGGVLTNVYNTFPLALLLHIADMEATFIDERS